MYASLWKSLRTLAPTSVLITVLQKGNLRENILGFQIFFYCHFSIILKPSCEYPFVNFGVNHSIQE